MNSLSVMYDISQGTTVAVDPNFIVVTTGQTVHYFQHCPPNQRNYTSQFLPGSKCKMMIKVVQAVLFNI